MQAWPLPTTYIFFADRDKKQLQLYVHAAGSNQPCCWPPYHLALALPHCCCSCTDKQQWQSELSAALGIPIIWNHWQAGHGKGEHDGVGALIKRALRIVAATEGNVVINSAEDLYAWCVAFKSSPEAKTSEAHAAAVELAQRRFLYVPLTGDGAVQHPSGGQRYTGAEGQRNNRCLFTAGTAGIMQMRELSCYCASCR